MTLKWDKDPSYWFGDTDAEYAWIDGADDLHWAVNRGQLAVFDNEYDRSMTISWVQGRSQDDTKALAERLQGVLSGDVIDSIKRQASGAKKMMDDVESQQGDPGLHQYWKGVRFGLLGALLTLGVTS